MNKDTGKVNIHGKEYETVASRVARLRTDHQFDIAIQTEIVSIDESVVVMKASAVKDGVVIGTGHAEENRQASTINRTSALENCETSAIGRCLASIGYLGTEFASADEVAQAISQQSAPGFVRPATESFKGATAKQIEWMRKETAKWYNLLDDAEIDEKIEEIVGSKPQHVAIGLVGKAVDDIRLSVL